MQSFRNLWNETFESEVCKEQLLQKAKIVHSRTDFWRFQTSAQKDYKCSPYLVHFLFPFSRKNVMQKPLCCIPPNIFAPWTQEIMKIMDADGDGVITTNELNQLKVDLYGMGWLGKWGWRERSTRSKTFGFLSPKNAFHGRNETWKTDWNEFYKNPSKNLKFWPYHRKTHQTKNPLTTKWRGNLSFRWFQSLTSHTFRWAFWGEESRALRGEGNLKRRNKTWFPFFWYIWPRLFFFQNVFQNLGRVATWFSRWDSPLFNELLQMLRLRLFGFYKIRRRFGHWEWFEDVITITILKQGVIWSFHYFSTYQPNQPNQPTQPNHPKPKPT